MSDERCKWSECCREPCLTWLGKEICAFHWLMICRMTESGKTDKVYNKLGILKSSRVTSPVYECVKREEKACHKESVLLDFDDVQPPSLE